MVISRGLQLQMFSSYNNLFKGMQQPPLASARVKAYTVCGKILKGENFGEWWII